MTARFDPAQPEAFEAHLARMLGRCRHGELDARECPDCRAEAREARRDWGIPNSELEN